jgi:protein-S-isoprenylcysteine O-methyltransferase Ste14
LRGRFPKPYADAVARLRVPGGYLMVAVFASFSHPTRASLLFGAPISILGLALRAWAAGCLAKDLELAAGGPYAYTRNPLYLGTLVVAAGLVVAARSLFLGVMFAAVFVLAYLPVIQNEEEHLRQIFPGYADYARRAPMLWPRLTPAQKQLNPFRIRRYLRNQEYLAAVGFAAGMLYLVWKLPG